MALALRLVGDASPDAEAGAARQAGARFWKPLALALGLAAAAATTGLLLRRSAPEAEPLRLVVQPPRGALLPRSTGSLPIAVSPDGRRVAFVASTGGVGRALEFPGAPEAGARSAPRPAPTSPFSSGK